MSKTIEVIRAHVGPTKRRAMPTDANPLTAIWQTGLEAGDHVQRKLRLAFTNVAAPQPA